MNRMLLILGALVSTFGSFAQTSYTTTYAGNVGNPGGINTDDDAVVTGWTNIIAASISTNQWSAVVPMPFSFNYFGNPVNNFKVSANGLITFHTGTAILPEDNKALPANTLPDSTIACFWDAFTTAAPTNTNDIVAWKIWGSAPNRQLWIKWASYEIGAPAAVNTSFMCMLEEGTDKIYLVEGYYPVSGSTLAATVTAGIQLNNTTAVMYGSPYRARIANAVGPADNNVLTFTPYIKTAMTFNSVAAVQPNTANISRNALNEVILRVDVNMTGELSPVNLTQLAFNTLGTTTTGDITNAKVFYGGNDSNYSTAVQFGSTITSPSGAFNISGSQQLKMGKNYFWLAYSISNSAAINNIIDASCVDVTVAGTPQAATIPAPAGSRTVKQALSGVVSVGAGNTYVYLSDVFKEINANGLSGNTTLSITSDIDDTATASLTYTSGSNYWLKIVPSADVVRTITARFANSYIDFSGSKFVTIDGKGPVSGTGKYLRFLNKDIAGSTFSFSNGARYDTIRNCTIEGAIDSQTKGVINLGISIGSTTGVRDIQILNNDIRDRADSVSIPTLMIFSAGTANLPNSNITVSNNNIYNFRRSAVYINSGGVNDANFTVSNNHMYYNASTTPAAGDVVPIMMIPGTNGENNLISGNYIGGQAPFCGGGAWAAPNSVNWVGMNINAGFAVGTSIQGNTLQNINVMSTTNSLACIAIRMEAGKIDVGTLTGNMVGHPTTPNSIVNSTGLTYPIYSIYGSGTFTIANNTVANITGTNVSTSGTVKGICIQAGGAIPTIYNNTIYNLKTDGVNTGTTTNVLHGIGIISAPEVSPTTIRNNKIYNLSVTSTTANTNPIGIVVDQTTANGVIEGNVIYGIENPSTGATASIQGIAIHGGTKNWIVRNNMVTLTNGSNTNSILIRGIADNNANNTNSYYNNSVYVGGTAASGTTSSYAFARVLASAITVRNNILYNERTGGTGFHSAIANIPSAVNWTGNTSGYNLLIAAFSASIGNWVTAPQTYTQWQVSSTGDNTSWSDLSTNVPASSFFKSLATGDLTIDSSSSLCWYANGKGIAIVGNTSDHHGQSRSASISNGGVDIGADEFPTTTLPPLATVTGSLSVPDSSIFTFAGRTLAKVYWNFGIPPTALNLRYYSGTNPPSLVAGKNYFNSYYQFIPTGGTGYNEDVKLFYDSALFKTVPDAASIIMGSLITTLWSNNPGTIVNTAEQSFRSNGMNTLNVFTGTDVANPLPTELLSFAAQSKNQEDISVYWSTASEKNTDRFEVEVSADEHTFALSGTIKANGNSNTVSKYSFVDEKAFDNYNADKLYYRLKMLDIDGVYTYSKTVVVSRNEKTESTVELYPNPLTPSTQLVITLLSEQKGSVMISDIRGNIVSTQPLSLQQGINAVSPGELAALPAGIYFIRVSVDNTNHHFKLVK
ncbi:MAG: BNR-repeat neuraminidase N-terminal domain-containing protein [Bacteroidota bacterium]